jgi:FkbM family methyltransferase
MKDYSQWGEQAPILEFFQNRTGRFLDLGAHDGIHLSNTRALAELGWGGVAVEADPGNFVELRENCGGLDVDCICGAISPEVRLERFVDFGCGGGLNAVESFAWPWTPDQERRRRGSFGVVSFTPAMLAVYAGMDFQMVSLDIEGADPAVLEAMGCLMGACELLVIEDAKPGHEVEPCYNGRLRAAAASYGLSRVLWSSTIPGQRNANTILVRG